MVALEGCVSAHYWGREISRLGHTLRLIAPAHVKPFVKREKNDIANAEAICEASQRPTVRFDAVKSKAQQTSAMVFKMRDLLVRHRTATINALRAHLSEIGFVAPKVPAHVARLRAIVEGGTNDLPASAQALCQRLLEVIGTLLNRISALDRDTREYAHQDGIARRLMTIPGIGPVIAAALEALTARIETFDRGRDFAAWLGAAALTVLKTRCQSKWKIRSLSTGSPERPHGPAGERFSHLARPLRSRDGSRHRS